MTAFVVGALLLALLAAGFLAWPLLRPGGTAVAARAATGAILLLLLASAVLYGRLGNRTWMHDEFSGNATGADSRRAADRIATLARHLERDPQDQTGWLDLGAAYESITQYPLAERAYRRADRLAAGSSAAALAGIGETLLLAGQDPARADPYFDRALRLDPKSPKALFYSAISAYHQGQLQRARDRFAAMLTLTPPPPEGIRTALERQIQQIDGYLHPAVDPATAIHLHIALAPSLLTKVPAGASLFVFVRSDAGPPLAVKRLPATLPQDVTLSAADAVIPGHAIRSRQKVTVVARVSGSGGPLAQHGDLFGQIQSVAGGSGPQTLAISQVTP